MSPAELIHMAAVRVRARLKDRATPVAVDYNVREEILTVSAKGATASICRYDNTRYLSPAAMLSDLANDLAEKIMASGYARVAPGVGRG